MISRRRLLLGGFGLVGVLGLGVWGFGHLAAEAEIVSVLRRRLAFLKLDSSGLQGYAKDLVATLSNRRLPTWNRLRYHFQSAVAPSFQRFYRSTDKRSRFTKMEDSWVENYLLSSDFFLNGADESRTVYYVALYDPLRPCGNPFARSVLNDPTPADAVNS